MRRRSRRTRHAQLPGARPEFQRAGPCAGGQGNSRRRGGRIAAPQQLEPDDDGGGGEQTRREASADEQRLRRPPTCRRRCTRTGQLHSRRRRIPRPARCAAHGHRADHRRPARRVDRGPVDVAAARAVASRRDGPADQRHDRNTEGRAAQQDRPAAVGPSARPDSSDAQRYLLRRRTDDAFGAVLYNLYGSTDVAVAAVATPHDLRQALGTVGRPPVGCTLAVYDEKRRRITEPGRTGTLFVSSGLSFAGYTDGGNKEIVDGLLSAGDTGHTRPACGSSMAATTT